MNMQLKINIQTMKYAKNHKHKFDSVIMIANHPWFKWMCV